LPVPTQLHLGDYVGGEFRILKVFGGVGISGMGVVYLVENRSFYEPFVLKTYQASELGDNKPRFLKEAQTWVNLGSHPNVVRCLWVKEIEGDLYIAADYIAPDEDGINTLDQRISQGKIPLEKQICWAVEFCYGMRHAYRKGVVAHRDLKPANLMLDQGHLKITDFGLTKFEGQIDSSTVQGRPVAVEATMQGSALGTPPFMSPEQFINAANVDQRADVYSFGVILYMMGTGELPLYPARPPKTPDELSLLWAIAHHRCVVRKAKFPLFPIVERCLQKNPAKRFQSFDEILAAISKIAAANKIALPKELVADTEFDDAYALAMSLVALGQPEEAVMKLEEITRRWPQMPQPFNEMGMLLMKVGKTCEAIPWFKRAVGIDESRSAPWNNLGAAHARLGELEVAEQAYAAAIRVDPENTGAMLGFSQMLMEKNPELAWKWSERAYELRPRKVNVLKVAGLVAMKTRRVDVACIIHHQLCKLDPTNMTALFNLALTYAQKKQLPEFKETAFHYLDQNPNDASACKNFCQSFLDMADFDNAADTCLRWSKIKDSEVIGTINLAHVLAANGKNVQGYHWLNIALKTFPRHPGLWLTIAHVLKELPQYREQARTAAENAITCLNEPITQPPRVTEADVLPVLRSLQ
jgi:serine/threonine protein kinase